MPKGKAKTKYNFNKTADIEKGCQYEDGTWCNLPKFKRCEHCIRCTNGNKACCVTAF